MCLDAVKGFIAHEESSVRLRLFEGKNALEIFIYAAKKIQVVSNVLIFVEGIFCQKHRQLCLNPKAGADRFLQKIVVIQGGFSVVVEKKQIQSKPVYGGELRRGKSFQPALIFLTLRDGFAVVSADSAKSGKGAGDSLLFRIGKGVMKCQGTAGNLLFKRAFSEKTWMKSRENMRHMIGKATRMIRENRADLEILTVDLGLSGIMCPPEQGDFYYIIEKFSGVCEIFVSMIPMM